MMNSSVEIKNREKVAKEIAKTSASIRKKYRALKAGRIEEDVALERHFKPIIEPLKQIAIGSASVKTEMPSMDVSVDAKPTIKKQEKEEERKFKRKKWQVSNTPGDVSYAFPPKRGRQNDPEQDSTSTEESDVQPIDASKPTTKKQEEERKRKKWQLSNTLGDVSYAFPPKRGRQNDLEHDSTSMKESDVQSSDDESKPTAKKQEEERKRKKWQLSNTPGNVSFAFPLKKRRQQKKEEKRKFKRKKWQVSNTPGDVSFAFPLKKRRQHDPDSTSTEESDVQPLDDNTGFETPQESFATSVRRQLQTPEGQQTLRDHFGPLGQKYMRPVLSSEKDSTIDYVYGVRFSDAGPMLGDKHIDVGENDDIIIGETRYAGTPGLYELIFKRVPSVTVYTEADVQNYKSILLATNAHRRDYHPQGHLRSNRGYKYKHVIAPLVSRVSSDKTPAGKGLFVPRAMMRFNNNNTDYVYWDDPNELVDRLRLLEASRQAGNNAHDNEILSIIEELREVGLIIN